MKKITVIITIMAVSAVFVLAACEKKEAKAPVQSAPTMSAPTASAPTATVPAAAPEKKH